jgi:3',5'-cyclic AMP phosphodiesterase CpdA
MRIASVSDLHLEHPENREVFVEMVGHMRAEGADAVVVAGDVSHVDDHIARAIRALRVAFDRVAYLPGNHDLWTVPWVEGTDTWDRHDRHLKELVESEGGTYLPSENLVLGAVGLSGTCGWYDHGFLLPEVRAQLSPEDLQAKVWSPYRWSDGRFVRFLDAAGQAMSDRQITDTMLESFEARLASLEANSGVRHVVAVTHHLAFAQAVYRTGSLPWEFFNAFMGSPRLGEVIRRHTKVRVAVYGHTHVPGDQMVEGIRVVGTPLGNPRERTDPASPGLERRIAWIDLPA